MRTGYGSSNTDTATRFNEAGAGMKNEDEAGDLLEEVERIHPVLDRLRQLLASATILDLKASAEGYWSPRDPDSEGLRHAGEDLAVQ